MLVLLCLIFSVNQYLDKIKLFMPNGTSHRMKAQAYVEGYVNKFFIVLSISYQVMFVCNSSCSFGPYARRCVDVCYV